VAGGAGAAGAGADAGLTEAYVLELHTPLRSTAKARAAGRRVRTARAIGRAAELAPIIAGLQASDAMSLRGIAAALNHRGIPTVSGCATWRPEQVSRVLRQLQRTIG
jgi:hypothetical protein